MTGISYNGKTPKASFRVTQIMAMSQFDPNDILTVAKDK